MRENIPLTQLEQTAATELLAAIVASSDDVILSKDTEGRITSWNQAAERTFGYSAQEVVGEHVSILFPDDLIGRERNILAEILAGRSVDHYETRRRTKDGSIIDVQLTVSPLRNPQGEIVGASKVLRDITERKRLEELARENEQLAAADKLKSQFLAMANHELRTPLTAISGFTRTLLDLELSPERQREFLEIMAVQSDRLTRLVDDMLSLSSAELGVIHTHPEPVAVGDVVRRALRETDRADVDVVVDGEPVALVDPHHMHRMVLNYVDNAFKYGAAPVTVHVVPERAESTVRITVCDSGPGVDPSFEARLFERFSRDPRHVEQHAPGTGLGLAIVRSLAEAQGGAAWYERSDSGGPCFCLRLPAAD